MNGMQVHAARALEALKSLLALVGVAGLALYFLLPLKPALQSLVPIEAVAADEVTVIPVAVVESPLEREQRLVAEHIAKRYRIADAAASHFVSVAYRAAEQYRVDALLVLAVMAIESRYNPVAESVMGAKGLMQVIAKYHPEKLSGFGGEEALLQPEVNILIGTQILREYYRRFGDVETALQMYAGALDEPTSQYSNKVLAEKARLEALRFKAHRIEQSV